MSPRLDYRRAAPAAMDALAGINRCLDGCRIEAKLRLLVEVRGSQINGCTYCVDKHIHGARTAGETQQRLDGLCVWRETAPFDVRERAALDWAEATTRIEVTHEHDDGAFSRLRERFDGREIVDLGLVIAGMNARNRIGVGLLPAVPAR